MQPEPNRKGGERRIPSLGGLRAISIGLVLLAHLTGCQNFFSADFLRPAGDIGNLGVRVFFVISGFLITTLLLDEYAATRRISLKHFYIRRTLRIFPAFYCFLAVISIAAGIGVIGLQRHDLLYAFTYTINYKFDRSWYVGHLWSLAVEEQFYLLWPMVLWLAGIRRGAYVAAGVILAAPAIRVAVWFLYPAAREGIDTMFPTVADALAVGCLLAIVRDWLGNQAVYQRFLASAAFLILPVLILLASHYETTPRISYPFGQTIMNVSIALCIDRCVRYPGDWLGRILNSKPFEFVGLLSYSLYLWQQPFLNRASHSLVAAFPFNLALASLVALCSYYIVEKPFLKLRKRFGRPPAVADLVSQTSSR